MRMPICELLRSTPSRSGRRLDHTQIVDEELVELDPVDAEVGASVTIGAHAYYVAGAVRAAVGEAVHMVAFDVEATVGPDEGARAPAVFALPAGAGQDVIAHVLAASKNAALCRNAFWRRFRCLKCTTPKLFKVDFSIRQDRFDLVDIDYDIPSATQFENDRIPDIVVLVGCRLIVVTLVDHFAVIAKTARHRSEKVDSFARTPGIDDSLIPGLHLHVADLALAEVFKNAILSPAIGVAVLATFFPTDDEDYRGIRRGDDPAPLLPVVNAMDVCDAVVNLANNKWHAVLAKIVHALIGCISLFDVKGAA